MYTNGNIYVKQKSNLMLHFSFDLKDLCALYIICWAIIPVMSRGNVFRVLAILCSSIFLLYVYINRKACSRKLLNYLLLSICMIVIYLGCNLIGNGSFPIGKSINLFVFVMLGVIAQYYYMFDTVKLKKIAILIIFIYMITIIPSIIAVNQNPYVLRNAAGQHVRVGIERFAGSYGYVYGCVLLAIFLTYDLHANKKS